MKRTQDDVNKTHLGKRIQLEEIRLLYAATPFSFTTSIIIALLLYLVLNGHTDSAFKLKLWFGSVLLMIIIRSLDTYFFTHSSTGRQQQSNWRKHFFIGVFISGLLWGALPWLGYSSERQYFDFSIICLVGVIAGSLSSVAYRWETIALFLIPSSSLLILRLLVDNSQLSTETSFLVGLFILFSFSAGKRIFNTTQQTIRLRLETDIREQAIELMHQKQLLHLQQTPLAIIEFDTDFKINEWNKAAESIFGYTEQQAIGENIMRLILPRDSNDAAEQIWNSLKKLEPVNGTVVENKTSQGQHIYCEWFITPLTQRNNEVVGIAAMALDISEKIQNERDLITSKEQAEKANQTKSDFLSGMSHELRTPLNAILGFTQLLKYEKFMTKKQLSHVDEISNAGSLLLELVNQILDLARIEKGYLHLSMEQVQIADIFKECKSMMMPLAKQYAVSINIDTDINGFVIADYTRLKQVMLNLLTNAIKYNVPDGSVSIHIDALKNERVHISIIDSGRGIETDLINEMFQPFNRLNAASSIEGTGIGLSISKQLMERMNGKIGAESTVNVGSEFWIELSGRLYQTQLIPGTSTNTEIENPADTDHNIKILVAEDNPTNQTLIINQLNTLGYKVDMVHNGQQALERLAHSHYSLLLTDCNMPLVDGYELATTIRAGGNTDLPIIALTADAFPEKKIQSLNAGMNDHITKPVTLEMLKATINKNLKIKT